MTGPLQENQRAGGRCTAGSMVCPVGKMLSGRPNSEIPGTGLEPAQVSLLDPKSSASTNSATPAKGFQPFFACQCIP